MVVLNSEVLPVYKNDRYKILKTEYNSYYLIDTDDKKIAFLNSNLALIGTRNAYELTEMMSDDLRVSRMDVKNVNNRIFLYDLIAAVIYYIIARISIFNLGVGYRSLPFMIFYFSYLLFVFLGIRLYLSYKEKKQLNSRIRIEQLSKVTLRLKSGASLNNKVKLWLLAPVLQWLFPTVIILGFSPFLKTPLELIFLTILACTGLLMIGNRSAFTNKYTQIIIKEIN